MPSGKEDDTKDLVTKISEHRILKKNTARTICNDLRG